MAVEQTPVESPAEIDRVRDILFGTQMRTYEHQFAALQRDLDRLQKEIDRLSKRLSDQDASQSKRTQELRTELKEEDDDLRSELRETGQALSSSKVDRQALADLFTQLAAQLTGGGGLGDVLSGLGTQDKD